MPELIAAKAAAIVYAKEHAATRTHYREVARAALAAYRQATA